MLLTRKYAWLVSTLSRVAGGLTLAELSDRYERDEAISDGQPLARQTLFRWRDGAFNAFGVVIECEPGGQHRYFISNPGALKSDSLALWLLDTCDTMNTLAAGISLRDRIVVDDVPSSHSHLQTAIQAMNTGCALEVTYRGFDKKCSATFAVEPYCLRLFGRRWYLLGRSVGENRERLYALDRVEAMAVTADSFTLPDGFDARDRFSTYFGVTLDDSVEVADITLRAYGQHRHYLRTLPLHPSQREVCSTTDYADFHLRLRPGYEFCMELLRAGSWVEVMEPQSLRHTMHTLATNLCRMYKDD